MTLKDLNQEKDEESLKKHKEELELNEKHLSLIYDSVSEVIFLLAVEPDDCFRFVSVNRAFLDATGLSREQVVGKRIEEELPETAHALVISKYKEAITENKTVFWEQASTYSAGELVGAVAVTPVRNAEGVCTHLVGTVHDITERKKAEEQIRFLSSVVEQSADGMAVANMEGNLLFVNDAWVSMHGYEKAEELLGQNLSVFHNEDQLKNDVEAFNRKVKEKGHNTGEVGHIRRDSTIFSTQMTTTLLRDENDNPIAIAGVATDITERKQAEEKVKEHHKNIELLSETAMQFVEFPQDKDIYVDSYIVVNSVNEETSISTIRAVLGLGKSTDKIEKIFGRHLTGMTFHIEDTDQHYTDGKMHLYEDGLYGLLLKTVPETLCKSMEKVLNIKKSYTIDLAKKGRFFGSIIIFFQKGAPELKDPQIIETFIKQASIAIQRKEAEEELRKLNDELEQRVKDRTAELENKNYELEKMNKVFVGRELRMVELKKQIAELEKDIESGKKAGDKTT